MVPALAAGIRSLPVGSPRLRRAVLENLPETMRAGQALFARTGGIHAAALFDLEGGLLDLAEDVGRHNAVDKIAGYMFQHGIDGGDKFFYTTGRLTSEMVIKAVQMGIPILASRSGFTAWGVDLARQVGLTLIGRARGKRFVVLSGEGRIEYDADSKDAEEEPAEFNRKGATRTGTDK